MKAITTGKHFLSTVLCKSLGLEPDMVRRVVLDVGIDSVVMVYVEMYGDERMLDISQSLDGVAFRIVKVEDAQP